MATTQVGTGTGDIASILAMIAEMRKGRQSEQTKRDQMLMQMEMMRGQREEQRDIREQQRSDKEFNAERAFLLNRAKEGKWKEDFPGRLDKEMAKLYTDYGRTYRGAAEAKANAKVEEDVLPEGGYVEKYTKKTEDAIKKGLQKAVGKETAEDILAVTGGIKALNPLNAMRNMAMGTFRAGAKGIREGISPEGFMQREVPEEYTGPGENVYTGPQEAVLPEELVRKAATERARISAQEQALY